MTRLLTLAVLAISFLCSSVLCQTDTCYEKTDILFVIDASGSVGTDNFQKQLQFAATFVNRFVIGQARFSLIRFESTASIIFGFSAYNDINALKNAILSIDYTEGGTDTAAALRLAKQVAFSTSNGARPGVPKVVVVCTDGQSNSPNETATEAKNLKDSKVLVLSIGIGVGVNKVELETIATYPGDVFVVIDYNQLLSIVYDYSELVCSAVKLFKCNNQADVYFLLDTSANIGPESFQKEREFVGNFSKNFDLETVYIGVGTFGGFATRRVFNLGQYKTQFLLEQGLSTALNLGGVSESNSALKFVADQRLFEPTSGGRANASKILIILTDGHSVTASQAEKTALQLRSSGIDIIAVGVSKPNITELKSLVGHDVLDVVSNMLIPKVLSDRVETLTSVRECQLPPSSVRDVSNICRDRNWENGIHPHPFNCSQFIECTFLKTDIMSCPTFEIYDPELQTCNYPGFVKEPCSGVINNSPRPTARPVTTLATAPCRTGLLDILLLIDSSDNVGATGFNEERRFAVNLPETFHLGPDAIQVAASTFSATVQDLFNFDQYGNYTPIQTALLGANYLGGTSNTPIALQHAVSLFSKDHGARDGVPKVAIIFTSGRSRNNQTSVSEATALKNAGVHVIALGFSNPNVAELQAIASSPRDVFYSNQIVQVREALSTYSNTTCTNTGTIICHGVQFADVIFVLDSSNSITDQDYRRQLEFVATVTSSFTIGPDDVRFGAVVFGTDTIKLFDLNQFDNLGTLRSAILSAQHLKSGTDTAKAINFINQQRMFSASAGGRDNATKIVIILTDGMSNSMTDTVSAAQRLKATGVQFISIGIGQLIFEEELRQLASNNQTVFFVANYDALQKIESTVSRQVCEDSRPVGIPTYYTTLCYDYSWADGIHPNPYDCSLYVECSASLTYLRNCLGGEAFDPTPAYRVCRDKNVAHTCSDPAYFGPTVVTAAPQVTASTRGPSAIDISDICQRYSLSDGIYPDPSNCNYFIECTNRGTQRLECPEGLHFNTANDVCDDVHAVNCQANYDFFFNFIPIIG